MSKTHTNKKQLYDVLLIHFTNMVKAMLTQLSLKKNGLYL